MVRGIKREDRVSDFGDRITGSRGEEEEGERREGIEARKGTSDQKNDSCRIVN